MKKAVILLSILSGFSVVAQVGINTTLPNAQLDVRSSNQAAPSNTDGMLIPKVDVFPSTPPTAAQQGMLVFLTTASGTNQPGFYYWDNPTTSWVGVGSGTANQWNLTGNSNTTAATNFIGTTNNQDLTFRRDNIFSGRIGNGNTFFGLSAGAAATGNLNTYIGTGAGSANVSGSQNVFLGRLAGGNGTSGSDNIFIGNAAGLFNTANNNLFMGSFSGNANTSGGGNIFIGNVSGTANSTGGQNTFVGLSAGAANTTGFGNTLLGNGANVASANLTNATAIGRSSQVAADNALVLGSIAGVNSATSSTNVGIGTPAPSATLDVTNPSGGILIPRVALTDANTAAPVLNPNGGAIAESTMVYNTATAGTAPDNVSPGFYYWNGSRWVRFDVNAENAPRFYSAVGTTNVPAATTYTTMPEMTITFTPTNTTAYVSFSGAGFNAVSSACSESALFFRILVNGVPAKAWQTTTELGSSNLDVVRPQWDTSIFTPVAVTMGIPQTVSIQWGFPGCFQVFNNVATPLAAHPNFTYVAHRTLTVIDPNGGGGIVGSTPALADSWSVSGNTITSPTENFVGTVNNHDLVFRRNNSLAGRLGLNNTSFGVDALSQNVGSFNTAIGKSALASCTSGMYNVAIGYNALSVSTGAHNNTAVGADSLRQNIGENNTAVGKNALESNTTGSMNTAVGADSLRQNIGENNTAVGNDALERNTTGSMNTAVGGSALQNNTVGEINVAIGSAAMSSNVSGSGNTSVGNLVMQNNTIGTNNAAFGFISLSNNTTGNHNTAIGYNALSSITAGSENTGVGAHTSTTSAILANATAVGSRATVGSSNSLVLGSIAGVNGATNSVNVGIGTISPSTRLEVVDENAITTATVEGNVNVMTNDEQGIDIGGSISLGGRITTGSPITRTFATIEGRKATATSASSTGYLMLKTNNAGTLTERMRITAAGDVGIGTPTPGGQLELSLNEGRKPGTNTWTVTSDARLKTVSGNYTKGLSEIIQLRPVRYRYKNAGERTFDPEVLQQEFTGFIAQDVRQIFPEAVGTDPDGYLNLDIHAILVAQINAIRELKEKNDMLTDELKLLKAQLSHQEQILERLRKLEEK